MSRAKTIVEAEVAWKYQSLRAWWRIRRGPFEFLIWDPSRWLDSSRATPDFRLVKFYIRSGNHALAASSWSVKLSALPTFEELLADAKARLTQISMADEARRILYPEDYLRA